jgi:hypothetical protein
VNAYDPAAWGDFALAAAGAAASLTGLIFVAVSINLRQILDGGRFPGRAAQTLAVLMCLVVVTLFVLMPGQSAAALGFEVIGAAALVALPTVVWAATATWPDDEPRHWRWFAVLSALLPMGLLLVGGTALAAGSFGGLYWLGAAVVVGLAAGVFNAWVLLVEINR